LFRSEISTSKYSSSFFKAFRFPIDTHREEANFFSNLYESYKNKYDQYKMMVESSDFHPVQDFRTFFTETAHQAEESAMATAHTVYESIIQPGSHMDKQISALSNATSAQLADAWSSVKGMKERLDTAKFLSQQRETLMQQLRGNRAMLTRMREMPYAVPSKQMAGLMRKITEVYENLESVEHRAKEGFANATGALAGKGNTFFARKEPRRYAKYSSDPLLGIVTYPLGFSLMVLGCSEIPLRVMLRNRGFSKHYIGPLAYYYYPGKKESTMTKSKVKRVPVVFVHGIGVGLITYMNLVDQFSKTGRPIFLPEIPYVSGFRPWLSSSSVLSPAVVASTLTAMLATHGFSEGAFVGHSYGTSWLSK
jgi:hypothetical protein